MGLEDKIAGKIKQIKGKGNTVAGAARGDKSQELKGRVQRGVGKVQEALGSKPKRRASGGRTTTRTTTTTTRSTTGRSRAR